MTLIYPAYTLEVDERYHPPLKELLEALKTPPRKNYHVVLKGYTDSSGSRAENLDISRRRAEHLKELLVKDPYMAIDEGKISVEGHGSSDPVASNETAEGRQRNRRVEIHIYGEVSGAVRIVEDQKKVTPPAGIQVPEERPVPFAHAASSLPASVSATKPESPPAAESVSLSLLEAIRYSLEGNQDIRVVSYLPKQAEEDLSDVEAVYDPSVFTDISYRREPNLQSSVENIVMEDYGIFQTGIRKPFKTGGSLSTFLEMGYNNLENALLERRYKYTFSPTVELRQPLLKNVGAKEEQAAIKIASHRVNISEEEFRQIVIDIATQVSRAYWRLMLFRELVTINEQNYDMAEEVRRREAVRLTQGISKPFDVERARSNAQARLSTLLKSKERFRVIMDQLKLLLNWSNLTIDSKVEIVPTEQPQTLPIEVNEEEAINVALNNRPEIQKARQTLEIRRVEEELSSHERLPKLDLFARYSFSGYGQEFSTAVDDTGLNDDNAWAVGLNFEWPMGSRSATARYRKKTLERQQATAGVERVRDQVELDVKQVLLAIDLGKSEIESTWLAKEAAENVVQGEFARFDLEQTSNEELLRAQDLLAVTSRNYIRAIVDYNIALAELERAQGTLLEQLSIESQQARTMHMESSISTLGQW
ncbi:MAG: TolC family protein [Deltaproteobacteria bacterium]|nr:MAG: TolC family protein [Deltaproteobacteria bacterium]